MSDVPQPPGSQPPGGNPPPPGPLPPGGGFPPPGGGYPPPVFMVNPQTAAAARTDVPGILLIVVGVLNLLGMGVMFALALYFANIPGELLEEELQKNPQWRQMAASGQIPSVAELKQLYSTGFGVGGGLSVISSILILIGGIKMRQLRAYGLAVVGALSAAVPCVSCVGCCGIGQIAGIWALVVLLSEDVRAGFAAVASGLPVYQGGPPAPLPGPYGLGTQPPPGGITPPGPVSPSPPPSPPQQFPWERPDQPS